MDAFYAAIEQRDRPELRGLPVIVGGAGKRGVVATASYEARTFGVRSAMPGARAHQLCPQGVFVAPRMKVYAEVSRQVQEIFESFTPLVEPLSLDEAFLDVTASRALFGDGEAIARELKARVREATELTVSVGVAACKFVAKIASDLKKPDGLIAVSPGEEAAFLAALPVSRLWGAGRVTQERFASLGLRTIAEVQRLSREDLVSIFGEATGDHLHRLCRGDDDRAVVPDRDAKSISHETTFGDDLADDDACRRVLLELSEGVGRRLRRHGLRGATVKLKLRFPPFTTITRQSKLARPTFDDLVIHRAAVALFDAAREAGRPVRLLGVGVSDLRDAGAARQAGLFEGRRDESPDRLLRAIDAIRKRFGDDAIQHGK